MPPTTCTTFRRILSCSTAVFSLTCTASRAAQDVTRDEMQEMRREIAALRAEVKELRAAKAAPVAPVSTTSTASSSSADHSRSALGKSFSDLTDAVDAVRSGETKVVVTGSADATFTTARNAASN